MVFYVERSGIQWFFKITSSNGNTLAHSENYHNHADAVSAAQLIINQAGGASIVG
ncbi:DUF1508 domain-containing protein [Amycolatopsis sp.]|jgi:uncharacterized protein YegP (UPF0339 family)|uniref:DUF1508 domain-containing protein n=1 Tax=Amycolatopsis sp. TaxID=37632 RepID=UPI002DF7F666|nr:DUF1508 domain-containing protein [Amycolatopsis sp.]